MFDAVLEETHGFGLSQTGSSDGDYIYLDDCVATGNRIRNDICNWLQDNTPQNIKLHVVTPILFTGSWWIDGKIKETAREAEKTVSLRKWRIEQFAMENRRNRRNQSDVLWPTSDLNDDAVQQYVTYLNDLGYPPTWRSPENSSDSKVFENSAQRMLLENEFLKRGSKIRNEQPNLPGNIRPLGYSNLHTLGFGSMFVTYRNCPNNCPIVLWIEQEDFPALFPRKTNTEALDEEDFF
jgi:hypothetical protein